MYNNVVLFKRLEINSSYNKEIEFTYDVYLFITS